MGRPASCKIDNWRVKVVSVFELTPPIVKFLPLLAPAFFSAAPLRAFFRAILVMK